MSKTIDLKNNFKSLKQDFEEDTGLKMNDNIELYIHYVNARFSDRTFQMTWHMMNELINVPSKIAFEMQMKGK